MSARARASNRRTQAERRADSEQRLLDATARLIAERGTSGASFTEIADLAGCSRGLPSYLFGTKVGLLEALAEYTTKQFLDRLLAPELQGQSGLAAITTCLEVFVGSLKRPWPHTRAIYVLMAESLGALQALRPILNHHHEVMREIAEGWIAEGIASGEIRADVDVPTQATVLVGLMRGIGLQVLSDPSAFDPEALAAEVVASVRRMLAADAPRG